MAPVFRLLFFLFAPIHVAWSFDHSHAVFNEVLDDVVVVHDHQTSVDYSRLKASPGTLEKYLQLIEAVSRADFDNWTRDQQLAYLINVYNAQTLKLIIDHYPEISSIRDLGGLIFSSPWDREFFRLFGEKTSLDHVEHDLIRGNFNEPRIHFAVNCASRGCPPLMQEAYTADKLDQQLDHATRLFMTDPERNRYDPKKNVLELSSIFQWYKQDFITAAGSVEAFVAPYITDDQQQQKLLKDSATHGFSRTSVRFLDYDWDLNDIKNRNK
ncbi:MAG: DUF547 domain-containing protein [Gammaproteobacteria bacterium]|nr:DUF547 domain-containing protein [Gammaproteobacteria bacterium]